ncbi:MAG: polyprenol monophosphomannose synthase [bacterium]|nr:polyprenol monophosphomannose synthase [bacterium]
MAKIVVVIPTYNEKDSIARLVKQIFGLGLPDLKMLVVDDNSPDGTGELVEELKLKYPISIIHRSKKRGLGTAYAVAFKFILGQKEKPDYIVQMDADLSHNPKNILDFLNKIGEYNVILGSRYIKGGGIENWDLLRQLVSRFGNIYARLVLGLPYKDLTGGFKCWQREVLEKINLDSLSSTGYNFQIETTYKAHKLGYKICEVPIVFIERKTGTSKFNLNIIWESFIKVLWLRLKTFL